MKEEIGHEVVSLVEALLMVADHPLSVKEICAVIGADVKGADVVRAIDVLNQHYEASDRSFRIRHIAGGYRIFVQPEYSPWIRKLYAAYKQERLSRAALETLAIIAYKQPITKIEIEDIRGVSCDGVLKNLFEKGFIKIEGRKEVPGRPFLYTTTSQFLDYFGLASLDELPRLEEFDHIIGEVAEEEVDLGLGEIKVADRTSGSEDSQASESEGKGEPQDRPVQAEESA